MSPRLTGELCQDAGLYGAVGLIFHDLNALVAGHLPVEEVIQVRRWFSGQVKLPYADGNTVDGALEPVYTKLIQLSRVRGWLRAKDVRNFERSLRKVGVEVIRAHFLELEAMGYGETQGMGNRLRWRATVDAVDRFEETVDGVSTAESVDG
jgi:hypothetical protein